MIFNMMSYGGAGYGDPDDNYAVWRVTYPAGSICTCTNSTDELQAPDTTGGVFFYIPSAGSWTVSCTDGTKTASSTVTFNTSTRIKATTLTYEAEPEPEPPATTATIKVTASRYGAINAMETNGEWTGGDAVLGTSATYTVPRIGTYTIAYVPQGGSVLYSLVEITALGQTVTVNADNGTSQIDDGGSTPTPTGATGTITATARSGFGLFNISGDDVERDPIQGANATWSNLAPGLYSVIYVNTTSGTQYRQVTVTAGETTTVAFN